MIIYNFDFVIFQDADLDILESDEDEIDEDSAVYLESLQDKLNKHVNGNMQVCFFFLLSHHTFFKITEDFTDLCLFLFKSLLNKLSIRKPNIEIKLIYLKWELF
jgi:hypothetical protein